MAGKIDSTSFWHQRHLEPKRKFRWIAEIGNENKLFSYVVRKVSKPEWTTAVKEHKVLGHTFHYPGPVTWNALELTVTDLAGQEDDVKKGNATLALRDMIHAAGYAFPEGIGGATVGVTKARATTALGTLRVMQLDAAGGILETYKYHNPFIEKVNFGDLDYEGDEVVEINMTIRYDWARIIEGEGIYSGLGDGKADDLLSNSEGLDGKTVQVPTRPTNNYK